LIKSPRAYVLNEFGTGKTRAVIWAADCLRRFRGVGPVLVAAPLSTLGPVWESELFRLDPRARMQVLYGTKQQRIDKLGIEADWYIINHHGLDLLRDELASRGFQIFVIDELAVLRNARTMWWRAANRIVNSGVKYVWGLTGSPTPKAPTDAWAQIRLLTPNNTTRSYVRFREATMRQVSPFKWAKRPGAAALVHEQMQPAVRYALEDVVELPPVTYRTFHVDLDPLADKAYRLMVDKLRILTNNGEAITAANEGVLQSKLLQVACGFVYTDTKGVLLLPVKARLDALLTLVEQTSRKYIVFVPFTHALEGVALYLQKADERISVVHGQTPVAQRNRTFRAFQEDDELRGIVAHPGCMAHGLNLTAANTIIWYSPTNSYDIYEQANARIARPGQTSKTLIAHLIGTSVERAVYQRLRDRRSFQGLLLSLFRREPRNLTGAVS
jgi:SNF2 family DNA or RNA helicase